MAKIHFIGGEKGGVGKSLMARVLAQYLIDRGEPFIGFDTDRSHGALMRFYSGYASPVIVDRYEALDAIMEAAVEQPDRRILVDLAAQTHDPLVRWMDDSGVLNLADESGISIHYWHVMDTGKDSVDLLRKLLDRFLMYRSDEGIPPWMLDEIRRNEQGICAFIGDHGNFRRSGEYVDTDASEQHALGFGHELVARPDHDVRRLPGEQTVGQRGDGLHAAQREDVVGNLVVEGLVGHRASCAPARRRHGDRSVDEDRDSLRAAAHYRLGAQRTDAGGRRP